MAYDNTAGPSLYGFNCINVMASDIIIDCAGGMIDGTTTSMGDIGIYIDYGVDNVTIRNCLVGDFGWQVARPAVGNIFINGSTNIVIENSAIVMSGASPAAGDAIAYNAFATATGLIVNNTAVTGAGGGGAVDSCGIGGRDPTTGVLLPATVNDVTLDNSGFTTHDGSGAYLDSDDVTIINGCNFDGNVDDGLYLMGNNDYIEGNTFNANGDEGFILANAFNSQILSNDVIGNGDHGLALPVADNVYLFDNNVSENGGVGIFAELVDDVTFEENEAGNNGEEGILVISSGIPNEEVYIYNNTVYTNDIGIRMENCIDSEVDGNSIWSNTNAGIDLEAVDPTVISNNDVSLNDNGIYACDVQEITFERNDLHHNLNQGLQMDISCDADAVNEDITIYLNDIYSNDGDGIYAAYTDNIVMDTNQIYSHAAGDGAVLFGCYAPEVYNNEFSSNSDIGLTLETWTDDAVVYDNTFADNDVGLRVDGIFNLELYDNHFWDNDGTAGAYIVDLDTGNIYENEFLRNNDGIYVDPSTNINFTDNVVNDSSTSGVFFDNVFDGLIEGNTVTWNGHIGVTIFSGDNVDVIDNTIAFNAAEGVRVDTCHFVDLDDNSIYNNTGSGIYATGSDFLSADPNYIYNNDFVGIELSSCDDATIVDNYIYDNADYGLYLTNSNDATVTGNEIYNNLAGVYLVGSQYGAFSNNVVYGHDNYGYFLNNADDAEFDGETIYGNGLTGSDYGFYAITTATIDILNTVSHDNYGGFYLFQVVDPTFDSTRSYNEGDNGFQVSDCTNAVLTGTNSYNAGSAGYVIDTGTDATMTDCVSYDQPAGTWGLAVEDAGTVVTADNLRIYDVEDSWLLVDAASQLDVTDLWLGFSDLYGIEWEGPISITGQDTQIMDANTLMAADFVAIDETAGQAELLGVEPAEVTTQVGGCLDLTYYEMAGLPTSADEIRTTGAEFTPTATSCVGTQASYNVPNFTGYTAGGTLSFGGGSSGGDAKTMMVESETLCPGDTVEFTVTHASSPVVGVEVSVTQYSPYAGTIASAMTDTDGKVSFSLPESATYRIYFTKGGYDYTNPYVLDYTMCGGDAAGCTVNSDCATNAQCVAGSCVALTGDCGYASGHIWIDYQCCADSDCAAGTTCVDHVCMSPEEEVHEEAPEEGTTPPEEVVEEEDSDVAAAALEALDAATGAIWEADQAGKDTTAARAKFKMAQDAYNAGDYEKALELANEAKRLANEAAAPEDMVSPTAGANETPSEDGAPGAQSGGLDIVLIIIGLVILGALGAGAYWLISQNKPKGGYKSRGQ